MKKSKFSSIWIYAVIALLIFMIGSKILDNSQTKQLTFSEMQTLLNEGKIKEMTLNGSTLTFITQDDVKHRLVLTTTSWDMIKEKVTELSNEGKLAFSSQPAASYDWIYAVLLAGMGGVAIWFMYSMMKSGGRGGANNFVKARIRLGDQQKKKVVFDDVAGAAEEKEELMEIVEFLKSPKKFLEIGARIPKGVLLVGHPGTGKTLLARAVAGEAGVPFLSISGSDFLELYVGVGAGRVRDLFEQAKRMAPAIVFIDEIDAVGRQRGAGLGGGHDEREQTLNQLLVEMDGFTPNEGIIVMAATNRPDVLDGALLRAGRFDRQITVDMPDVLGREGILKVHARNKKFDEGVDFKEIAKQTVGFSGADLENVLNEAAIFAVRRNKKLIDKTDISDAITKVIMGVERKSHKVSEKERKLTAYHEAGHAICAEACESSEGVAEISIIPRGRAGGYTMHKGGEDRSYRSKNDMIEEIAVLLGGRVAEKMMLDDISTGASSDIQRASAIARSMVTKYGMSDKLGPIIFGDSHDEVFLGRDFSAQKNTSEAIMAEIDNEIKSFVDTGYEKAHRILEKYKDKLILIAETLLQKEKLSGDEFKALFNGEATSAALDA